MRPHRTYQKPYRFWTFSRLVQVSGYLKRNGVETFSSDSHGKPEMGRQQL